MKQGGVFHPKRWWTALAFVLVASAAQAHKGSDAYLDVQQITAPTTGAAVGTDHTPIHFKLALAVAIRDLDLVVPVDANADARVTWGEIRAATPQVLAVLNTATGLATAANAPSGSTQPAPESAGCALYWQADGLERRSDGLYFRAVARAHCATGRLLRFHYALLKEEDATHRLLITGRIGAKDLLSTMSPQQGSVLLGELGLSNAPTRVHQPESRTRSSRWATLSGYFGLGMHHLLEGYDHLAFLLALVLPLQLSVRWWVRREILPGPAEQTGITENWRANWLALLRTVTAFTVGHSITLMLATFGWTEASPRWVEPAIALSIGATAVFNLYPRKWVRFDVLALLFGLIHGFGFAGLLQEMAAPTGLLPWALAGFNLGVEAGQLAAVLGWVAVSQVLVGKPWYHRIVVRGGSALLLLLSIAWFWQRVH